MENVALYGDPLAGIHPGVPPANFTGSIYSASDNVYINGKRAARVDDTTIEYCSKHEAPVYGKIIHGSQKVFINDMPAAYARKDIQPHFGTASLTGGGSTNVFIE